LAIEFFPPQKAVVVFDSQCELAEILTTAYKQCLPDARFIDFENAAPASILETLESLKPSDLVVLIQSTNFRLEAFRIRVELFNQSLKVIEHPHLSSMKKEEIPFYIDSLAYDPAYYRGVGKSLKEKIDSARKGVIDSGGETLVFDSGFEEAKLNTGDYSEMKNVGGQFPIGEVFTEAKDLEAVNGRVRIFVFGDTAFRVNKPEKPITLVVDKGRVVSAMDSTEEFDKVLANIRADEGEVWIRELGFGMNRALTEYRIVSDIGTYERMCGVHLSLGAKHGIYKKPYFKRKEVKHHVDVFAVTKSVTLDNLVLYADGAWLL
jgi:aminopeptidase